MLFAIGITSVGSAGEAPRLPDQHYQRFQPLLAMQTHSAVKDDCETVFLFGVTDLSIGNVHSNKKWLWNWPLEQAVIHVTCFSFPQILEKIANYKVVIIEGETGCGKSTQVPQFILDECVDKHKHCNIVVTQPRKIAATSLARRVCRERGWQLGKLVGYQVGQFSGAICVAVLHLILTIKK